MCNFRPDEFFTVEQYQKLTALMTKMREAHDDNRQLPLDEQSELEKLIDEELDGVARRIEKLIKMRGERIINLCDIQLNTKRKI